MGLQITPAFDPTVDEKFTAAQTIQVTDATNNNISTVLTVSHDTTGTPANGMGPQIALNGEDSTTNDSPMSVINSHWSDVTHATRTAYLGFASANSGNPTTERFYIFGSGGASLYTKQDSGAGIFYVETGLQIGSATQEAGRFPLADGTKFVQSAYKLPTAIGAIGQVLNSDGANAVFTSTIAPPAGTSSVQPIQLTSGTNLTSAAAGSFEFDGVQHYHTIDTTSGRGAVPVEQYFHLTSNGGSITTINNWFGTTSNIKLVASAYYEIDIYMIGVKSTTGDAVTFTLTNSAAPTKQHIFFDMCPITGATTTPGASRLFAELINNTAAAPTIVTGTLTLSQTFDFHIKILLQNGTGTSLKIQATNATGITPQSGSRWICRRMSPNNIGTFAT